MIVEDEKTIRERKIFLMKKLLFCFIGLTMLFSVTGCDDVNKPNETTLEQQDSGYVLKETADVLVAKFNTEVVDNGSLNPASEEYLTIHEDAYWYGLISGIYLIVYPIEYTGDLETDIVDYMVLYVENASKNEAMANEYMEHLIKANNSDITTDEVKELMAKAKESASMGKTVNNGKGIDVGYVLSEDNYQYQVIRLYE